MSSDNNHGSPNRLYETNDYSIVSKYSAANLGYFDDPLILKFAKTRLGIKKRTRRAPLVNIGYANRVLLVDHNVANLIMSGEANCVIVLGCGFDILALRHINTACSWIEIDLREVIETKASFLALEWNLPIIQVHSDPNVITFENKPIHLISCDIRFQPELSSKLSKVLALLKSATRFVVLNEVCLNYLETNEVMQVISTIEKCIKERALTLTYLGFEQVRPTKDDPFTKVMADHFESINHPLKHLQTRDGLQELFLNQLQFDSIDIESLHRLYRNQKELENFNLRFRFNREPFDEFEELDMYMAHYAIVKAKKAMSNIQHCQGKVDKFRGSDLSMTNAEVRMTSKLTREVTDEHIRRYAHSVCILKDRPEEQSVLVSGGFGVVHDGERHRRLGQSMMMTRNPHRQNEWRAQPLSNTSFLYPLHSEVNLVSMHGETCCVDPTRNLVFFCPGRGSPSPSDPYKPSFVARITPDYELKHEYSFSDRSHPQRNQSGPALQQPDANCWRHRIVRLSQDVIQLGGLPARGSEIVMVRYKLHADAMGTTTGVLKSVEPRHSFGADVHNNQTLLIYGGLKAGLDREDYSKAMTDRFSVACDRDIRPAQETILYDFRIDEVVQKTKERGSSSYGMQVHFVNDNQFVRVGGISTASGLAEQSIDLFDLRRLDQGCVVKTPIVSRQNDLLLCNAASLKFESTKQIVTFGGGGTCFTFGTHFNRSQIIYDFDQLPAVDE